MSWPHGLQQAGECCCCKCSSSGYLRPVKSQRNGPIGCNTLATSDLISHIVIEPARLSLSAPMSSHHGCGGARVGLGQISWPDLTTDRSISDAMGRRLFCATHDRPPRGRCRPRSIPAIGSDQSQCPRSLHAHEYPPGHAHRMPHVDQYDTRFIDEHTGSPEQRPTAADEQAKPRPQRPHRLRSIIAETRDRGYRAHGSETYGQPSPEARAERLGLQSLHTPRVPENTADTDQPTSSGSSRQTPA